ncbi:ComF family protein [Peteryoungia ipomoeae]|uniref:ComF family protein n=1 Tax=Peteryoungia ipomoeae TaxID=1210932 RepID=A0A4S8NYA7_9HYPH|nr:ComF family protein [Peteryoungia ipomoeae]THV22508.1 ComF family protein [Peteryoungia ipomoeae]
MLKDIVQKSARVSRVQAGAVLRAVLSYVHPPVCAGCGMLTVRHQALCVDCWASLRLIERPFCEILGSPFAYDPGEGAISPEAIANPPVFDRLRSVALYEGVARQLVQDLKYRDRLDLAPMMAAWMMRAASAEIAASDAVVSVPLHRMRLMGRMFNQSAELARHLARQAGKPFLPQALIRKKRTTQQVGLTANQRLLNVRGAFAVPDETVDLVLGRRLILIDDVYTTGATVGAAVTALKRAGVADVTVLTFARALAQPI